MTAPGRHAALTAFYHHQQPLLERAVTLAVNGLDPATMQDACQIAWLALSRRDDVDLDAGGAQWLRTTAIRAAIRELARRPPLEHDLGRQQQRPNEPAINRVAALDGDPELRALQREQQRKRRDQFDQVPARARRAMLLKAAGYSYADIAAMTGTSWSTVNRQLARGRAIIRNEH